MYRMGAIRGTPIRDCSQSQKPLPRHRVPVFRVNHASPTSDFTVAHPVVLSAIASDFRWRPYRFPLEALWAGGSGIRYAESMSWSTRLQILLSKLWHACPVSMVIVAIAVALYAAGEIHRFRYPDDPNGPTRVLGASSVRVMLQSSEPGGRPNKPTQLSGPFDLWDGQWWRVPISGFHHGSLWHLVFNCVGMLFLGWLLEPRMHRLTYIAFFLLATTVSLVPEFLLEHSVVGLSGGIYAMFGALLVLRQRDEQVAEFFHEGVVYTGIIWLFACVILTKLELLRVANVAHCAGFAYGWIAGQVLFADSTHRRGRRFAFCAAHVLLIPMFYYIMNPYWIGRHHWYRAASETSIDGKVVRWQNAVKYDPGLSIPWVNLTKYHLQRGDVERAWSTAIEGLYYNRSDEKAVDLSRKIWWLLRTQDQRENALQALKDRFADEAVAWQERLGATDLLPQPIILRLAGGNPEPADGTDAENFPLDRKLDLPTSLDIPEDAADGESRYPEVDPNDPTSAAEGIST